MTGEELLVCVGDVSMGTEEDHVSSGTPGEEIRDSGLREPHEALGNYLRHLGRISTAYVQDQCAGAPNLTQAEKGNTRIPSVG